MSAMYSYNPQVGENWRWSPNSEKPFKISRTKIELFCKCKRCFYREVRLGLRKPPMPSWAINSAIDGLLKKEMDECRKEDRAHGIFTENHLNLKPFNHDDIENWQNAFHGIQYHDKKHNFLLYGGVDDVMIDEDGNLVVIDFKSTAKKSEINEAGDVYDNAKPYKRQLEIYSFLLQNQKEGFNVSDTGYLMYYNGDASKPYLGKDMHFRRTLVKLPLSTDWIPKVIEEMYDCLHLDEAPPHNPECENCLYLKKTSEI
tara:strand:- start:436 stop:1206 length:771 start_codon:yes stop_codon:yes gene_type:complete